MPACASRDASQLAAARMGGTMSITPLVRSWPDCWSPGSLTIGANSASARIRFTFPCWTHIGLEVQSSCGAWNRPKLVLLCWGEDAVYNRLLGKISVWPAKRRRNRFSQQNGITGEDLVKQKGGCTITYWISSLLSLSARLTGVACPPLGL